MLSHDERAVGEDRRPAVAANPLDATSVGAKASIGRTLRILAFSTLALPLLAVPGVIFPFVVPRAVTFRFLMGGALVLLISTLLLRRNETGRRDPILIALVAFFFASVVSALAGVAVYRSLYGNLERMWGVWGWFNIVVLYVLLRTALDGAGWNRWLRASLWVSGFLGLYALAQYFELRIPLTVAAPGRPFATLGNPGYLAVFALLQLGLGLLLQVRDARTGWIGWTDRMALGLTALALVLANTRSVLLGTGVGVLAAGVVLIATGTRAQRARGIRVLAALVIAGAAVLAFALAFPELVAGIPGLNRISVTTAENTNVRLIAWKIGLEGFRARPLLGWGMDNFAAIFDTGLSPEYFSTSIYNVPFDRVHNAYIELLATGGVVGLLAFLAIFAAAGWLIIDGWRRGTLSRTECAVFTGVVLAYLVYLVFWFEDLSSLIALTALLALLGARSSGTPLLRIGAARADRRTVRHAVIAAVSILVGAALWLHAWKPLRAARALALLDNTEIGVRIPEDLVRTALSADLSRTHALTIMTLHLRGLVDDLDEIRRDPEAAAIVGERLERTLVALEREIARDPLNSTLQVQRASTLLVAALLTRGATLYESALDAYRDAIRLSPNQVHHRYRLAEALMLTSRHDEAMAQLDTAAAIAPAFGATDYFRARFALQADDVRTATSAAHAAIEKGYVPDPRMGLRLDEALEDTGEPLSFRVALLRAFLLQRRGRAGLAEPYAQRAEADRPLLERLAALQQQAGHQDAAQRLRALIVADSVAFAESN